MHTNELMIYRNLDYGKILRDMTFLIEHEGSGYYNQEDLRTLFFECVNGILELSEQHGLEGNLWHTYLTFLLVNDENAYSTACEIRGMIEGSINEVALHDFVIMKELFDYDVQELGRNLGATAHELLFDYKGTKQEGHVYNRRIRDRICTLAVHLAETKTPRDFKEVMTQFYKEFGVGKFGLHKAFRVEHTEEGAKIVPITKIAHVRLDDLVGYEIPKKKLIENTEAFVRGRKANNCLLFGDAGTGKSTSIKAILNQYYEEGLRMIEVYKHQFQDLNDIIAQVKNRKAVIEGGLERKPENVLIYATSNRRHLVREQWSDKNDRRDDDLHTSDTVQEKLSLVARFGVSIFFVGPDKKEFQKIVLELAKRNQIQMEKSELLLQANQWEMTHGGRSGRTAQQFIDYLLGKA